MYYLNKSVQISVHISCGFSEKDDTGPLYKLFLFSILSLIIIGYFPSNVTAAQPCDVAWCNDLR